MLQSWKRIVASTRSLVLRASGASTYVDGGAQVCVITEDTERRLPLKFNRKHAYNMNMANNARVWCVGVADQVLYVLGQQVLTNTRKIMVYGYDRKTRLTSWGNRIAHQ